MKHPLFNIFIILLIIPLLSFSPYYPVHGTLLRDSPLYLSYLKDMNENVEMLKEIIVLPEEPFDYTEVEKMVLTLANIDDDILKRLSEERVYVKFFTGLLTNEPSVSDLRGKTPRGYFSNITWDDVPGVGGGHLVLVKIGHSEKGKGHGSINLELHEVAHSIDRLVFDGIRTNHEFLEVWKEEAPAMFPGNDYFTDYPEEYFAEAFAFYCYSEETREYLRMYAPKTYQYIRNLGN